MLTSLGHNLGGIIIMGGLLSCGFIAATLTMLHSDTTEYRDCAFFGEGHAFVDENQNHMWDGNEPPLSGVKFLVDDPGNNRMNLVPHATSDSKGIAPLGVSLGGCPKVELEVHVEQRAGYELTTAERLPESAADSQGVFTFGFFPAK